MRSYYPGITLFKVLGCILVVFSHELFLPIMSTMDNRQLSFAGLSFGTVVPGFYLIAGFLAYQGWMHAADAGAYVRKYVSRIAIVYGLLCLLNTGRQIAGAILHGDTSASGLLALGKRVALRIFVEGAYQQLWFIPPLIFGILVSYALVSGGRERQLIGLAALALAAAQCLAGTPSGPVRSAWPELFGSEGARMAAKALVNYGGFGLVFVGAGVLLARHEEAFKRLPVRPLLALTGLLAAAETAFLWRTADWSDDYRLAFSTLPASVLMFYGIVRIRWDAVRRHHRLLNRFSLVTFFGHTLLIKLDLLALGRTHANPGVLQEILISFLTLAQCAALTYAWMRLVKQRGERPSVPRLTEGQAEVSRAG
ncbi:acyltransferase family protein [Cohnella hashimotonis]|uniref:Acyltransferase family protein n=1 Tax=Cohnella hashimotonis TaxID=2826895 RepID=A0ABT6TAW7_9BACL|nr:acyltransferase family protein [Cohnella hashimotonis]MDI4643984.1 acyltransferase family protein [Cohnella hashimotonis]